MTVKTDGTIMEITYSKDIENQIKRILGEVFFVTDFQKDVEENCDFLIKAPNLEIACRIRTHKYLKYKDQFTLRCKTRYGNETEYDKLIKGFGRYMFYAFQNKEGNKIEDWVIIDLNELRHQLILTPNIPKDYRENYDGTAFYAFKFNDFSKNLIYRQST